MGLDSPGRHSRRRYSVRPRRGRVLKMWTMTAAIVLVAAGLLVAVRPAFKNAILDASANQSGPLFGAAASSPAELAQNSAKFGSLGVIRTAYAGLPALTAWNSGALATNKAPVIVTFTGRPAAILS